MEVDYPLLYPSTDYDRLSQLSGWRDDHLKIQWLVFFSPKGRRTNLLSESAQSFSLNPQGNDSSSHAIPLWWLGLHLH